VAASTIIYAGSIVAQNVSGYAVPASATSGFKVIGRAEEYVDNSAGAAGAKKVNIRLGIFNFTNDTGDGAIALINIGSPCFAKDDQTVSLISLNGTYPYAGVVYDYNSTDGVWVDMSEPNIPTVITNHVTITAAQVKAIRATPITLVGAPGAGKVVQFISGLLYLDYGSEVFAETIDNLAIKYTNGSGAIVSQTIENTGFIDQAADTITSALPKVDAIVAAASGANQALVLHNTGDGEITGNASNDSVLDVYITYQIIKL